MSDKNQQGGHSPLHGLASLPVFFELAGKCTLLAGGSTAAAWKAELLQATGARVEVCTAEPSAEMESLAARTSSVTLIKRIWRDADFYGKTLAIGDFTTDEEAAAFRAAARHARVPVNIVDKPGFSDFQFGSIIDRSPLVVAISTKGAAPIFAVALRGRLEALLPQAAKLWTQAAQSWRPKLKALGLPTAARRRFWELLVGRALA